MILRKITPCLFYILIGSLVLACGGGSDTVPNQGNGNTGSQSGPPAANNDIRKFETEVWTPLKADGRCGQCHGVGQSPNFVNRNDVNQAYLQVVPLVDLQNTAASRLVTKVATGHNCWLTTVSNCTDIITGYIDNWAAGSGGLSLTTVKLIAPSPLVEPGSSKNFPALATDNAPNSFAGTVHPLLTAHCQSCHEETALLPISPFFANGDASSAYEAAKPKMDLDIPGNSRFVLRLREEFHNCWTIDCAADASAMEAEITSFASAIVPTSVDPALITSKALTILDGIIASSGSRHEANMIALWQFKEGAGNTAADTSGIDPATNLTLSGSVGWLGGYGIDLTGGKAQSTPANSKKLYDFITATGEYSIEAWTIPANVTQEMANIVSYSAGVTNVARNFTLGQTLYNYDFFNRIEATTPVSALSTMDAGEILQSSLQHVVTTYDPINGRSVYVNGSLVTGLTEPVSGSTAISNWDDSFSFVLGNEESNDRPWNGKLRLVAIHNQILTAGQVQQNFDVGVGEKYFLLFSISHRINIPDSFIMFEVSQFDSYSYLFDKPVFINLDPNWIPVPIDIEGIRIGINGKEAVNGQTFANLDTAVSSSLYTTAGQSLSTLGAVVSREKSDDNTNQDEFFLTFEKLGSNTNAFNDPKPAAAANPPDAAAVSDIGVRTFEEINASISAMTGIPVTNANVSSVFTEFKQQFPTVEAIDAFLPSHQMAIAQLALASCNELVNADVALGNPATQHFTNFDFTATALNAFDNATKRDQIFDPLLAAVMNVDNADPTNNLTTQPSETEVSNMLSTSTNITLDPTVQTYNGLINQMTTCGAGCDNATRTQQIVKAVCTAAVGGAISLIQ